MPIVQGRRLRAFRIWLEFANGGTSIGRPVKGRKNRPSPIGARCCLNETFVPIGLSCLEEPFVEGLRRDATGWSSPGLSFIISKPISSSFPIRRWMCACKCSFFFDPWRWTESCSRSHLPNASCRRFLPCLDIPAITFVCSCMALKKRRVRRSPHQNHHQSQCLAVFGSCAT